MYIIARHVLFVLFQQRACACTCVGTNDVLRAQKHCSKLKLHGKIKQNTQQRRFGGKVSVTHPTAHGLVTSPIKPIEKIRLMQLPPAGDSRPPS